MAQNDLLKRYLDAGMAFTSMTQARAEAIVKDLVKAGEVQADQARDAVTDLVERSRKSSEKLVDTIRTEIASQVGNLGLATKADIERLERKIAKLSGSGTGAKKKATSPSAKKAAPRS